MDFKASFLGACAHLSPPWTGVFEQIFIGVFGNCPLHANTISPLQDSTGTLPSTPQVSLEVPPSQVMSLVTLYIRVLCWVVCGLGKVTGLY